MKKYQPREIEQKWQKKWEMDQLYRTENSSDKPKKYILDMFPYPSGDGLHVGHFKPYTASDIIVRYYRSKDFNVLHPMGWDAFGLPAENYALKKGVHPAITTKQNVENIKKQMQMVGFSYDWTREINTTDPNYYKWTQWIFIKLFKKGLAYESLAPINWCPQDKTGLANEEVVNGKCERCGAEVERREIRQWILKITDYADRLLEDVQNLDWPQSIKDMQINWIGRSEGSLIKFDIENRDYDIEVFTTRVDTLFGATALILAPEHGKVQDLITNDHKPEVESYIKQAANKSDLERTELVKEKTGVFTGSYALNPSTKEKIPIWVADYVLGFYGTGAVMLVPAHDERDYLFAKKYNLEVREVIKVPKEEKLPYVGEGVLINSDQFNGLSSAEAKKALIGWLKEQEKGDFKVQYKLRDWIFSRQRYWGEPIPIVHCDDCGLVAVPEDQLPVKLPEVEKYEPTGTGESPLANIPEFVNTTCPECDKPAKRETNTMPQWAGSCWYYLRFCDPDNDKELISKDIEKYWLPVDWYIGSADHAVLHLLYSRFWHKFLYDIGVISTPEPFMKLSSVGFVQGPDGQKMSKSKGNFIRPDDIVKDYGADTLRVYEAFMGPFENAIAWDPTSIIGVYKFLTRISEVIQKEDAKESTNSIEVSLNRLINKVAKDIEGINLNTAVSSMMEFINLSFHQGLNNEQKKRFLIILAPFAPHITEELWEMIGEEYSIHLQSWPTVNEKFLEEDEVTIVIQVNGKVRDQINISKNILNDAEAVKKMAYNSQKVKKFIEESQVKNAIYVPGKILNLVTG